VRQSVAIAESGFSRFNPLMCRFESIARSKCDLSRPLQACVLAVSLVFALTGCDSRIEQFESNRVFTLAVAKSRSIPTEPAAQDVSESLEVLFGTPNEPRWPEQLLADGGAGGLVDLDRLERAAGAVSSEKDGTHRGLFREHCVVCHALEGSGAGPASQFQDPYPRDFRHGVFKWKRTIRGAKPTKQDLRDLLTRGVPGTGMPSFALLSPDDLDALVDYVIYLSVRGETERRLLVGAVDELGYGDTIPEDDFRLRYPADSEGAGLIEDTVLRVAGQWSAAETRLVEVPDPPDLSAEEMVASIERGKKYFHGQIANCVGCHGASGNGAIVLLDYDDWTKDYTTRLGLTPSDREAMQPFRDVGALRPRPIKPRNLQKGVFRGGGDGPDLYCRITQGIAGTPMPAVSVVDQENGKGLTQSQVWDLVHYVQSLAR
jgi:mono/diheme cytochrome c family protein